MDGLALYGDSDHDESGDSSKSKENILMGEPHTVVDEMEQSADAQPAVGIAVNENKLQGSPNSLFQKTSAPATADSLLDSGCESGNKSDISMSGKDISVSAPEQKDSSATNKTSSKNAEKSSSSTEDSSCKKHVPSERMPSSRDHSDKRHMVRNSEDRKEGSGRRERRRSRSRERTSSGASSNRGHGSKPAQQRHRSRSRERSRRARSKSKDRRRSRSRSPRPTRRTRSRSRDRRRSRSREKTSKRSRSRDRHAKKPVRSRTRSRSKEGQSSCKSSPPSAPKTDNKPNVPSSDPNTTVITVRFPSGISHIVVDKQPLEAAAEVPSNLPLHDVGIGLRPGIVTPQMAVQQAMAAMNARTQMMTGVALPKYYNPSAVNPMKYAEQIQKRKLLWQSNKEKKEETAPSSNQWESTMFPQDQDGKMAAKFKKLMGIKNAESAASTSSVPPQSEEQIKKQEELFRTLDQQYEVARISTHTHRGVGLGFSSAIQTQYLIPK